MQTFSSTPSACKLLFLCLFLFIVVYIGGRSPVKASETSQVRDLIYIPGPEIIILAGDYKGHFFVPPPQNLNTHSVSAVTINVTYVGAWTPDAQTAFQAAVDIWAGLLTLPSTPPNSIDVEANWTPLGVGVLGSAGAFGYWTGGTIPAGIRYPDALADAIIGIDLGPTYASTNPDNAYEIIANFNSNYPNWYTGTDGSPSGSQFDLMTVVLHELGHGAGFAGSANVGGASGSFNNSPFIYDCFTADGSNVNLLTYGNPSVALGTALRGDDIHFGGSNAVAGSDSGFNNAKLYAPATWSGGSSYSHLDDATYDGTPHALMTHALGLGEAVHDPGTITMGILTDLGWNGGAIPPTGGCPAAPTAVQLQKIRAEGNSFRFDLLLLVTVMLILTGGVFYAHHHKARATSTD